LQLKEVMTVTEILVTFSFTLAVSVILLVIAYPVCFVTRGADGSAQGAAPGATGGNTLEVADWKVAASPIKVSMHFAAHGMGLVTDEAPRPMQL
jgi:hypothetical protein